MEKIKVEINRKQESGYFGTLGMPYLLGAIKGSDLFEIGYHNEMLNAARYMRATTLFCNGKKVYLDFWEYPTPTYTLGAYNYNFDLIIKIQDRYSDPLKVCKYLNRKRMLPKNQQEIDEYLKKIVPWTFFPSRIFEKYVGQEEKLFEETVEVDKFGFFCGKAWKCRNKVMSHLNKKGVETWKSDQGNKRSGRPLKDSEFMNYMKRSKFGIVLAGRASAVTDSKNRREIDYMMLKKPLLLNYKPKYYNELVEGKHYIHFDENTDLNSLENRYNIKEIGENGYQWYLENVPPAAAAKTFRKILNEKLNI